jgi:hypothetical protein
MNWKEMKMPKEINVIKIIIVLLFLLADMSLFAQYSVYHTAVDPNKYLISNEKIK